MVGGPVHEMPRDVRSAHTVVHHDREPPFVREREHCVQSVVVDKEALAARMQLDPDGAGIETTFRLAKRGVRRVKPAEGGEPAAGLARELDDVVVRAAVAVWFL